MIGFSAFRPAGFLGTGSIPVDAFFRPVASTHVRTAFSALELLLGYLLFRQPICSCFRWNYAVAMQSVSAGWGLGQLPFPENHAKRSHQLLWQTGKSFSEKNTTQGVENFFGKPGQTQRVQTFVCQTAVVTFAYGFGKERADAPTSQRKWRISAVSVEPCHMGLCKIACSVFSRWVQHVEGVLNWL